MLQKVIFAAFIVGSLPTVMHAQCRIAVAGTGCVAVPQPVITASGPVKIGAVLARGQHSMVMNVRYYGLPGVSDGWVYMQIEDEIYRVDWQSHTVLERVTHLANSNW